jgi:hypothetical protein
MPCTPPFILHMNMGFEGLLSPLSCCLKSKKAGLDRHCIMSITMIF